MGSSGQAALFKQGHPRIVPRFWNIPSEGEPTASLGSLFSAQSLHSKEALPHVQAKLPGTFSNSLSLMQSQ